MSTGRRYLTLDDVVQRYGGAWSRWQLYERSRLSTIPHRKRGNRLLFLEAELDLWDDGVPLEIVKTRDGRVVRPAAAKKVA